MNNQQSLQNPKLQRMLHAPCDFHFSKNSVLLAYYDGGLYFRHQELAAQMKAPLGTVKSWVRRGLSRLRECLES